MHYMNRVYNLDIDVGFDTMFRLIPNAKENKSSVRGMHNFCGHDKPDIPFVVCDEDPWDKIKMPGDIIFMTRGILDTLVSLYFHDSHQWKWFSGDIKTFLRDSNRGVMRYVHYMNAWAPPVYGTEIKRDDGTVLDGGRDRRFCLFKYEDLSANPQPVMNVVAEFLKIPFHEEHLRASVDAASFENMLQQELRTGIPEHTYDRNDVNARRVRSGKIGGWKDHLDDDDVEYICTTLEKELNGFAKQMVEELTLI